MKIVYTKHAQIKFKILNELNFHFEPQDIAGAIKQPDYQKYDPEEEINIILKEIDPRLNLRVVYSSKNDIITIITFYPVKKGRYAKE